MTENTPQAAQPNKMNVESFNLDHREVVAPYVRVANTTRLPSGDTLVKYDVRFTQPNKSHMPMPTIHSLEHLVAELMRNHTDKLLDFSPMGCQTGFYALTLGVEYDEFLDLLQATLEDVLQAESVPAANVIQCGWGANHSLGGAQEAAASFLRQRDSWADVFGAQA